MYPTGFELGLKKTKARKEKDVEPRWDSSSDGKKQDQIRKRCGATMGFEPGRKIGR